ncbi:MAG: 50S ribosomal protein L35ae [Nanoarchaeota archaeon]
MEGIINSFRRGRHTQTTNQMIIVIKGVDNKDKADKLIGKTVSWKSPAGKELKGKVSSAHGNKGAVRALFETGMPGQSLGTKVSIQ